MRLVVVGGDSPGVLAISPQAIGVFAIGQFSIGIFALGQSAVGVIAIGQLARGGIAVGQLALGLVAVGQLAIGVLWVAGMVGIGAFNAPLWTFGFFGQLSQRRVMSWLGVAPHDRIPLPFWRLNLGFLGTLALAALWWYGAGQWL